MNQNDPKKEEEERKKAGVPLTLARGGKGVASLARGGAGMGAGAGTVAAGNVGSAAIVLSKAGILIVMTALGIGAWGVGQYMRPGNNDFAPKTKVGADKNAAKPSYDVDPSSLPKDSARNDAMMVVPTSLDGKTEEQRRAEAEAAAAAAKAQEEANKPQEPKAPDANAVVAGVVPGDAAAAAAAGAADGAKKGAFANKFGTLSTLGSGRAGGSQLTGGSGNFGGVGQNFGQKLGSARGMGVTRSPGRTSARIARGTPGRSAFRQLQNANALSRAGASGATGEAAATSAGQAFNNNPGANSAITGQGAQPTNTGGVGGGNTAPSTNPSGSGPTLGTENYGNGGGDGTSTPPMPRGQDVSPWKMAAAVGGACLMLAGVLLMASAICSNIGKGAGPTAPGWFAAAKYLAMAAMALGAIATLCGLAVMGMGQTMYGMIMTGGGALITVLAYMAMSGAQGVQDKLAMQTELSTAQAGQPFTSQTTGMKMTFDPNLFGDGVGGWTQTMPPGADPLSATTFNPATNTWGTVGGPNPAFTNAFGQSVNPQTGALIQSNGSLPVNIGQ